MTNDLKAQIASLIKEWSGFDCPVEVDIDLLRSCLSHIEEQEHRTEKGGKDVAKLLVENLASAERISALESELTAAQKAAEHSNVLSSPLSETILNIKCQRDRLNRDCLVLVNERNELRTKLTESDKLLGEAVELLTRATANHVQSFIKPSDWRKRRDALLEKLKEL